MGQDLLSAALLHDLEAMPCFAIGHPDLLAFAGAHTPEEALVSIICEARKAAPSILYLPNCDIWWTTSSYLLKSTFLALMNDLMSADVPLLFLATCDCGPSEIPEDLRAVFFGNAFCMRQLTLEEKLDCFDDIMVMVKEGYEGGKGSSGAGPSGEEDLPLAPPDEQVLQGKALQLKLDEEEENLRQLRMVFRSQVLKLLCEHRWRVFTEPLREEEKKEVENKGGSSMDLLTLLRSIDTKKVSSAKEFEKAIADIVSTTEALYSESIAEDARIISRAHALKDAVDVWLETLPKELASKCEGIVEKRRQEEGKKKEEENATRRVSARSLGEVMDDSVKHLDPEALARKLRSERRQAEEQEALEAKKLEEERETERLRKEEEDRKRAEEQKKKEVPMTPPTLENLLQLQGKLEVEVADKRSVHDLESFHACLKQLTWSYRMEPNRINVCEALIDFMA
mmetsp:Transcript_3657/g.8316  ORF Transcript_3657/g.8316 Transcript_3657/m.8316 type:complete len:454 (+) Transcript_3657:3-1364(+)